MRIGVDYYPEHWDRSLWEEDIALMAKTGVKVVRLAEFAWSVLEPREGEFDFGWLDEAIALFEQYGISIVLGTPTNCPPLWLYRKYPDAVQCGADGSRIPIGIRGHRCYNSPALREKIAIIIGEMTKRYRDRKSVIAWQIDNELEANFCRCEHCQNAFRIWLQKRYPTIEELNAAYGNAVWSGSYSCWEEVTPPMGSHPKGWYNPSLMLDYHRFAAESTAEFVRFQIRCLCDGCTEENRPVITTNTWFCENQPDFASLFKDLDFVSYDNYPPLSIPQDPEALCTHAFHLDLMRGIKQKNFWVMEQLSGAMGSWAPMSRTTSPGMIRGYALQAFAHGADTVVHFRWRTAAKGAEMFWHGLIDHSNIPGRRFREFEMLCKDAQTLTDAAGSVYRSETAILYSADSEAALRIQPQADGFHYLQQLKLCHDACLRCGVNVDIIPEHCDLSGYKVLFAPALFVLHSQTQEKLHRFVEEGGILLMTARSAVKDAHNACIMEALPAGMTDLFGAAVTEYDTLGWAQSSISMGGKQYRISQWCDLLECRTARPLAVYEEGFYAGTPAATCNTFGKGRAYYLGTVGERALYKALAQQLFADAEIPFEVELPPQIELSSRENETTIFRFLFNQSEREVTFRLFGRDYTLPPFGMEIERMEK